MSLDGELRKRLPTPGEAAAARAFGIDSRGARVAVAAIIGLGCIVAGAWMLVVALGALATVTHLESAGERTRATIVAVETAVPNPVGAPDDTVITTTVGFRADGVDVTAALPDSGTQADYLEGSTIAIVFDPEHPATVMVDVPQHPVVPVLWAAGVLAVGLGAAIVAVRLLRGARQRPESGA